MTQTYRSSYVADLPKVYTSTIMFVRTLAIPHVWCQTHRMRSVMRHNLRLMRHSYFG